MVPWLRRLYPFAASVLMCTLVLLGDGALLILGMVFVIACIPLAFGPDALEIARDLRRAASEDTAFGAAHPHRPQRLP